MNSAQPTLRAIFGRMKAVEGLKHDADLAPLLFVSKARIGQWKVRGTIPWERIVRYSREHNVSLDHLVHGKRLSTAADLEDIYLIVGAVLRASHELGANISPDKFARIVRFLHSDICGSGKRSLSTEKIIELIKVAT